MLQNILNFKRNFISNSSNRINDFSTFKERLTSFARSNIVDIPPRDIYWNNYLHAALISSAFETLNTYNLEIWNQYFTSIEQINEAINVANGTQGDIFELFILHTINHVFDFEENHLNIKALRAPSKTGTPSFLTDDTNGRSVLTGPENDYLLENLKVGMKIHGFPMKRIWGDNDIVVTLTFQGQVQQFCIISCKTSLRERVYQNIFWATHSRLESIGKHVLATLDKGSNGRTEIGNRNSDNTARKTRDVMESSLDRTYVFRHSHEVNRSQAIKDFSYLKNDLDNWARDIAGI